MNPQIIAGDGFFLWFGWDYWAGWLDEWGGGGSVRLMCSHSLFVPDYEGDFASNLKQSLFDRILRIPMIFNLHFSNPIFRITINFREF